MKCFDKEVEFWSVEYHGERVIEILHVADGKTGGDAKRCDSKEQQSIFNKELFQYKCPDVGTGPKGDDGQSEQSTCDTLYYENLEIGPTRICKHGEWN